MPVNYDILFLINLLQYVDIGFSIMLNDNNDAAIIITIDNTNIGIPVIPVSFFMNIMKGNKSI